MMLWKQVNWLHKNLPYPFLKLWGSSEKLVDWSRKLAYGGDEYKLWYGLLQDMEKYPLDRIREFQLEKLKKMLDHAYKNVPYYKEMFNREQLKPSAIKSLEDLKKLPIITKDDIIENYNKFFAKNLNSRYNMYRETSGTTGRPVRFYLDKNAIGAYWAGHKYFRSLIGYTVGKDMVLHAPILGPHLYLLSNDFLSFGYYSPVLMQVIFSSRFVGNEAFGKYVKFIKKFNIKHIEGFPSILFAFAKYIRDKNEKLKIKTTLTAGEVLYEFQRKMIKEYLECEVFNRFGSIESTIVACECHRHEGMHISLHGIAEVNGQGFEGNGELVMTNLTNYTMPLIRYNTKDIVALSQKKCSCGRSFPRLMSVEGRENDFIILPDGEYIHPSPLAWSTVVIPNIKDIFFFQHEDYSLDVLVVKEEKGDTDKIVKGLRKRLKKLSKGRLKFRIIFKDSIERKSKKFRVVETKVSSHQERFLS